MHIYTHIYIYTHFSRVRWRKNRSSGFALRFPRYHGDFLDGLGTNPSRTTCHHSGFSFNVCCSHCVVRCSHRKVLVSCRLRRKNETLKSKHDWTWMRINRNKTYLYSLRKPHALWDYHLFSQNIHVQSFGENYQQEKGTVNYVKWMRNKAGW